MKKALLIITIGIAAGAALIVFFKQSTTRAAAVHGTAEQFTFNITFDSIVPNTLSQYADSADLCSFAWNEFFALNWKSSYKKNTHVYRGYADPQWTYNDQSAYPMNDPVVWETYAHRVELRPNHGNTLPFDKVPRYDYQIYIPRKDNSVDTTLFNNLDENNEIGSCDLYAKVNLYNTRYQVLYQAKVNRDEYDYKRKNYPDEATLIAAVNRTASNIKKDSAYYNPKDYPGGKYTGGNCNCPPGIFCLPCGNAKDPDTRFGKYTGALEVKSAWREMINDAEANTHFTRKVIVYEKDPKTGKTVSVNKTYGLIGIHIIHKLANYPAFTFATFEHTDVQKDSMGYIELPQKGNPTPQRYERFHPISVVADASTKYVQDQLRKKNPNSIWLNYRLVGVQGMPTNDSTSFSFYLANYVIESDRTLGDFRGSGFKHPHDGGHNVFLNGKHYSMGGCQGCHGVAQGIGADFSFLMDATPNQPDKVPDIDRTDNKLKVYIDAFEKLEKAEKKKGLR
nr:hypothetical protein [uncultured Chitinophaga sp.]